MSFGAGVDMSFMLRNPNVVEGQTLSFFDDWFKDHKQQMSESFDDFLDALYIEGQDSDVIANASLEEQNTIKGQRDELQAQFRTFFADNLNITPEQAKASDQHLSASTILLSGVDESVTMSPTNSIDIKLQGLFSLFIDHSSQSGQEPKSIANDLSTLSEYLVAQDLNKIPDDILAASLVIDTRKIDATNTTLYQKTTEQLKENLGPLQLTKKDIQEKNIEFMIAANATAQSSKNRFKAAQQRKEEEQKEEAQQEADDHKAHQQSIKRRQEQELAAKKQAAKSKQAENKSKKQKK